MESTSKHRKRKQDWNESEDPFSITKKRPQANRSSIGSSNLGNSKFNSPFESPSQAFPRPSFPSELKPTFPKPIQAPKQSTPLKAIPKPPIPFRDTVLEKPETSVKKLVALSKVPIPFRHAPNMKTPSKPMRSIIDTPLAPGALETPSNHKLTISLSQLLDGSPVKMTSPERAVERGLAPSPEKGFNKKGLIRGGLAEHAKGLITRSTTDFSLWYQDKISSSLNVKESSLRLLVLEIVCRNPSSAPPLLAESIRFQRKTSLISLLARCQILSETQGRTDGLVLFVHHSPSGISEGRISNVNEIQVGCEVFVWKPWSEVTLPSQEPEMALLCSRFAIG